MKGSRMARHGCSWIVVLLFLGLVGVTDVRALKPLREYPSTPDHFGIIYDRVRFATRDGHHLLGWFFPAQDTLGIATDLIGRTLAVPSERRVPPRPYATIASEPGPTIVICDGDAGNMAYDIFYAYHYFTAGFNVFTFDWRGFGGSDPWPGDENLLCHPEFLIDYHSAIDYVKQREEVDSTRIGLLGFSTGAYLSFATAAQREDVAVCACRALMTSFADLLEILGRIDPAREFRAPEGYPPELEPVRAAARLAIPVLLVVGENDERTPAWMSRTVAERLAGPHELWVVPGATHGGRSGPELTQYPEFFQRTAAFFRRYLRK